MTGALIGSVRMHTHNFLFQNIENSNQKPFPSLSQTLYYQPLAL